MTTWGHVGRDIHLVVGTCQGGRWGGTALRLTRAELLFTLFADQPHPYLEPHDPTLAISAPRGVPADASRTYRAVVAHWAEDGHSHSWLTLAELLGYDWHRAVSFSAVVGADDFLRVGRGEAPRHPARRAGGTGVEWLSLDVMATRLRDHPDAPTRHAWVTQARWAGRVADDPGVRSFRERTLPELRGRVNDPADLRLAFFFDN